MKNILIVQLSDFKYKKLASYELEIQIIWNCAYMYENFCIELQSFNLELNIGAYAL